MGDGRQGERPRGRNHSGSYRALEKRVADLGKEVRALKDQLRVKDNGNAFLTDMTDKLVSVEIIGSDVLRHGRLCWFDKFNIGIKLIGEEEVSSFNKGNVVRVVRGRDDG
jgi:hypothetical protein